MKKDMGCPFVSMEVLIFTILILKADISKKKLMEVSTSASEMNNIHEFCFKNIKKGCVFETSSKDLLGAVNLWPEYFNLKNGIVRFQNNKIRKHNDIFYIDSEVKKLIRQYLEETNKAKPP